MKAIRLTAWEQPRRARRVAVPEPGPGEVLVRVAGAGLCHSDLHLMHWPAGTLPYELPFTLGHEVAGTVAALGPGADGLEPGEPVLVYGPWGCGRCRACSVGAEHLCERARPGRGAGLGRDGGLAEYMVVPSPLTVPLDGLDPVAAAPLADAGLTPYHADPPRAGHAEAGDERDRDRRRRARARRRPAPEGAEPGARRRRGPPRRGTRGGGAQRRRRGAAGAGLDVRELRPPRAAAAPPWSSTASAATTRWRWPPAAWRPAGTSRCSGWPAGRSRCASAPCRSRPR